MKDKHVRDIVDIAIVAALYVVVTLILYPLSYGAIQFRISECLVLLTYYNKKHGIGVVIGVLIANCLNPEFALLDLVFGTLSTLIAVILICFTKSLFVSTLWPTLTSVIVAIEVAYVTKISFLLCLFEIGLSMFIIESIIGYFLFRILSKKKNFLKMIRCERKELLDEI